MYQPLKALYSAIKLEKISLLMVFITSESAFSLAEYLSQKK